MDRDDAWKIAGVIALCMLAIVALCGCLQRAEWFTAEVAVSGNDLSVTPEAPGSVTYRLELDPNGRGRLLLPANERARWMFARATGAGVGDDQ